MNSSFGARAHATARAAHFHADSSQQQWTWLNAWLADEDASCPTRPAPGAGCRHRIACTTWSRPTIPTHFFWTTSHGILAQNSNSRGDIEGKVSISGLLTRLFESLIFDQI